MTTPASSPTVAVNGVKFRELRKERGKDAQVVAVAAEITRDYLYKLERSAAKSCRPGTFGRLCAALELTNDERRQLIAAEPDAA